MAKKPARRRLQGEDGTPISGNDPVNMTSAQHIVFNLEEAGAVLILVLSGCEKGSQFLVAQNVINVDTVDRSEVAGVEFRNRLGVRGGERRLGGAGGVHSCWVDDEMRDVRIIGSVV